MVLQAFATLWPLVDRESGRLVDHQHQPIAVEEARNHLFGCHLFRSHAETAITTPNMNDSTNPDKPKSWWQRLTGGLKRTSNAIGTAIADLVLKRKLDSAMLEEIEELLIRADLGVDVAARIAGQVGEGRYDKAISPDEVKAILAAEVEKVLVPVAWPLVPGSQRPFVILVVGVNGSGKTTTIGKLAATYRGAGQKVMLAAGDTFRAAAIDQLKIWGQRAGAAVVAGKQGADAAGLAFDALAQARRDGVDVLLVDTAGRLQNRTELMDE